MPFFRTAEQVTLSAHILSVSAALVGVCLTVIGIIQVVESMRSVRRIEDNLLALDSIAFLAAVALSYGAIRSTSAAAYHRLERAADACFLTGLSFMAVICVLIAYEVA